MRRSVVVVKSFSNNLISCADFTFMIHFEQTDVKRTEEQEKSLSYDAMSCVHKNCFFVGIFSIVFHEKFVQLLAFLSVRWLYGC